MDFGWQDDSSGHNGDLTKTGPTERDIATNQAQAWGGSQFGGFSGLDPDGSGKRIGPSGAEYAAQDYRQKGYSADNREGVQLKYGDANQSLGQASGAIGAASNGINDAQTARMAQYGALDATARAAEGQQPSRAEILGKNMIGQSLRAQVGGAASARGGPLAQMAARRQVAQGAAGFQAQGTNQLSALRADEMERARNQWMQGATGIRGQDYQGSQAQLNQGMAYGQVGGQQAQMAQAQGSQDAQQRQLNQQDRQFYEQTGWNTQNSQADRNLTNEMDRRNAAERHWETQGGMNTSARQKQTGAMLGFAGGVMGMMSDVRAKQPASLGREKPLLLDSSTAKAADPNWLDKVMGPERAKEDARRATEHETKMKEATKEADVPDWLKANEAPDLLSRDDPYGGPTPGGITRQDPYGGQYNPRTQATDPSTAPVYFGSTSNTTPSYTPTSWNRPTFSYGEEKQDAGQGMMQLGASMAKAYGSDDQTKLAAAFTQGATYAGKQFGKTPVISAHDAPSYVFEAENAKQTGPHDTKLSREDEQKYQAWKKQYAPNDSGQDYDLRGAYKSGLKPGENGHWADTFKKPNHETFSNESQYARGDDAMKAGHWDDETFHPMPGAPNDKTLGALRGTSKALNSVRSAPTQGGRDPVGFRRDHGSDEPSVRQPTKFTRDNTPALVPSKGGESKGMNRMSPKERASPNLGATSQLEQDANRKLAGSAWTYKDNFRPGDEEPGQLHYGGMAQNYETNPITKTAVRMNPETGMREIDMPSMMQVQGSGIASLQNQVDELEAKQDTTLRYGKKRAA